MARTLFAVIAFAAVRVCIAGAAPPAEDAQQAAAALAQKKKAAARWRQRKPCAPEDARCLALRDHICDPYFVNVTDKCTFVQENRHCAQDVHHIAYLPLFYCRPPGDTRVLVAMGFVLWMGVLFWVMAVVAEDFLVPALEYLAAWMHLAPDVAGVTLFAFASGAPDLFTQIAAVAVGGNVDQELAVGATLGAGLFIVAVILSVVMLVAKPAATAADVEGGSAAAAAGAGEEITDRRAFVRDAVVYLLSTLALLGLMLRGTFTAWEAALLLLGYVAYLAVCIWTSRGGGGRHHSYLAVAPSQHQLAGLQGEQQQQQQHVLNGGGPVPLHGVVVAGATLHTPRAQVELVSRVGGVAGQRKASLSSSAELATASGSMPASPGAGKLFDAAAALQQQQRQGGTVYDNELVALVGGMPASDALPAAAAGVPAPSPRGFSGQRHTGSGRGGRMAELLHSVSLGLEELLHTKGKTGPRLWLSVAMAPLTLVLHATMPALHTGYYTPWYALLFSLCAPLFSLLSTELYPHHLSTPYFLLTWLLAALVLLALLMAVPPAHVGNGGNGTAHNAANGSAVATMAASSLARSSPGSPFGSSGARVPASSNGGGTRLADRCWQACYVRRPRRNVLLAVLASAQCMLWMSVAADELVSLFQAIGRIVDVSQDVLGATVLAWGEAVPELVATMSLARSGQATMAIAAVFGGPIFNVLIAWAGPTLYAALRRHGPLPYKLSPGVGLLVLFTVIVLAFLLIAMPLLFRWRLSRKAAIAVLSIYALSQVLFFLVEGLYK